MPQFALRSLHDESDSIPPSAIAPKPDDAHADRHPDPRREAARFLDERPAAVPRAAATTTVSFGGAAASAGISSDFVSPSCWISNVVFHGSLPGRGRFDRVAARVDRQRDAERLGADLERRRSSTRGRLSWPAGVTVSVQMRALERVDVLLREGRGDRFGSRAARARPSLGTRSSAVAVLPCPSWHTARLRSVPAAGRACSSARGAGTPRRTSSRSSACGLRRTATARWPRPTRPAARARRRPRAGRARGWR